MGEWLILVGICFVGAMVPGANTALVLRRTLAGDRKGAFITVSGLSLGLATHVVASMLGITALISETPALYDAIRWLGSAYLVYMGATYLLTRGNNNPEEEGSSHLSSEQSVFKRPDGQPAESKAAADVYRPVQSDY